MWKSTRNSLSRPENWWGEVSGNHQGGASYVSQVDKYSDMLSACQLCRKMSQKRNKKDIQIWCLLCQHFCLFESYPTPALILM